MWLRNGVPVVLLGSTLLLAAGPVAGDPPARVEKPFAPKALGMDVPVLTSADDLDKYIGRLVAVRGTVSNTKLQCIVGVFVDAPDDLRTRETDAYAVGILGKWTVTEAEFRKWQDDARKQGNRIGVAHPGPGVYYSLYADLTGKLAEARPLPKGDGK